MSEMVSNFSGRLFALLAGHDKDDNVVCSPLSAVTVLGMALAGAQGNTASQIRHSCGFGEKDLDTFKDLKGLIEIFMSGKKEGVKLNMANRIFAGSQFSLRTSYVRLNKEYFLSEPKTCNFKSDAVGAARMINGFVEQTTNGKIKEMVSPDDFDEDTALVLVNAIYFKGVWESPFQRSRTDEYGQFSVTPTRKVTLAMMHHSVSFGGYLHYSCDAINAEMLEMCYKGGNMAMIFVLPFEGTPIKDVEKRLEVFSWTKFYTESTWLQFDDVAIPRFQINSIFDLKQHLVELGIQDAFCEQRANFRGMSTGGGRPVFISMVVQRSLVGVDEDGTEAAAATAASVRRGLARKTTERRLRREFKCDRPFLFVLVSKWTTNSKVVPCFMGRVVDPTLMHCKRHASV